MLLYVCVRVYMYIWIYVCMYIHIYIYIYIYICVYIYIYIYTHTYTRIGTINEQVDADCLAKGESVCWWHMKDGAVLGVHNGAANT